jgi:archaellin
VLAGVVLNTGMYSSDRLEQTGLAALRNTDAGLELRGPVLARTDGSNVLQLVVTVAPAVGGDGVDLRPDAPTERTTIAYRDDSLTLRELPYATSWIVDDGDLLLETGELAELTIDVAQVQPAIAQDRSFVVEIRPARAHFLVVERTMPSGSSLDLVVNLR